MKFLFILLSLASTLVLGRVLHDKEEMRALNLLTKSLDEQKKPFVSSTPLIVSKSDVAFYVYNNKNTVGTRVNFDGAVNISTLSSFDVSLPTFFITHGWSNTYKSTVNTLIKAALLNRYDVNVIVVYWDFWANLDYATGQVSVPKVGSFVGQFIEKFTSAINYSLSNITLVGHSLGAHISGFAGQYLNGSLPRIVGLDPAGPLYFEWDKSSRLSEDDAKYVQAIHTDAELVDGLGAPFQIGDVDFWPNGGEDQPGCILDPASGCSHGRSYIYYAESISTGNFIGLECSSYDKFEDGGCADYAKGYMGGYDLDETISGYVYFKTNSKPPYAQGDIY